MRDITGLKPLAHVFSLICSASALTLNLPKCSLMPLNPISDPSIIPRWISAHASSFVGMTVAAFGEYLGILLGPGVYNHIFEQVIAKYYSTCRSLANSVLASSFITIFYDVRAATLFSHVFQDFHPNDKVLLMERRMLHSIYKTPFLYFL